MKQKLEKLYNGQDLLVNMAAIPGEEFDD
jgi:hypothetical protein